MAYEIAKKFTPEMEGKDYVVFLKTNFQSPILNEKGNICGWRQDADNYTYAIFPNRRISKTSMMSESYVKPEGSITCWKDKLPKDQTMELDALTQDLPATWDEFSDLLTKLVSDHTVRDGVIVIEDAATWQKMSAARRKLLRKEFEESIAEDDGGTNDRFGTIYPLVENAAM